MIVYGYAKDTMYTGSGELNIQVRIPNIHGPYEMKDYRGNKVKNYVQDKDLPWYPSLLLPYLPNIGEVVALISSNESSSDFLVIGLTGGQYFPTNPEE